jgi:uncharacterized protein related to proFAR isomerase
MKSQENPSAINLDELEEDHHMI